MAAPARPKPKFPNAKTYKDRQGNIREVGTGRLIRRAPAPAPKKPKTFTDAQGVVRQAGTARGGRPAIAVNPLERQVDSAILTQTSPLNNRIGQSNSQYEAESGAITGAGEALSAELAAIQQRLSGLGAQQLGAAASAAGGTAEQQQANLAYLQNLLGSAMSDTSGLPGAVTALAAQAQGEGAGAAANIALGQRGAQNDIGTMGGASAMQSRSALQDRLLARNAALRDYNDQIAAIRANRVGIKNDLINTSLDQQAARQQIRLAQAEHEHNIAMDEANLDLAQDELAAGGGSGGGSATDDPQSITFAGLRLAPGQAQLVRDGIGSWREAPDAKRTLNSFMARVTQSSGLSRTMVARVAMNVLSPSEVKRYGGSRARFLKTMAEAGVSEAVRTAWANKVWGSQSSSSSGGGGSGGGPVTPGMVLRAIRTSPYDVKVGTTFRLNDRNFTVQKVQRTISGLTYTMRGPQGREFVVTAPNPTS